MRDPLRRLKIATADLHVVAEEHVPILDVGATRADYARHLRAMVGWHLPVELLLASLASVGFEPERRRRAHLLARDLTALGESGPWPVCERLPAAGDHGRLLGIAYVLEGSKLGGRYVLARLPEQLAALRGRATAYFEADGSETGVRWRAFTRIVEREIGTDARLDAAIAGARDAFASLVDWLARHETRDPRRRRLAA